MITYFKVLLIIVLYLLVGMFFKSAIPGSDGKEMFSMIFLWAIYIPILLIAGISELVSTAGECVGNACRKKFKKNK